MILHSANDVLRRSISLVILGIVASPLFAGSINSSGTGTASLGPVKVLQAPTATTVSLTFTGPIPEPRIFRLQRPDRIGFDFLNVTPKVQQPTIRANASPVVAIRMALWRTDSQGQPVTRVVIDLDRRVAFTTAKVGQEYQITVSHQPDVSQTTSMRTGAAGKERRETALKKPELALAVPKPPELRAESNTLKSMSISSLPGKASVVLDFQNATKPKTFSLAHPPRFVLDFVDVNFGPHWKLPPVVGDPCNVIKAVRASTFKQDPPTARIVFDQCTAQPQSPVVLQAGNRVCVNFGSSGTANQCSAAPPTQTPQSISAPIKPASVAPTVSANRPKNSPRPTTVEFQNGLLRVDIDNLPLADVLYEIGQKTGASIQLPMADAMLDRVSLKMGPEKPARVLATLLQGSRFTYFFVEDSSGHLQKVILTARVTN
jgi:hypothetical protein